MAEQQEAEEVWLYQLPLKFQFYDWNYYNICLFIQNVEMDEGEDDGGEEDEDVDEDYEKGF